MTIKKTPAKKSGPAKSRASTSSPAAPLLDTAPHDSIAANRRLAIIDAAAIPKVPSGFVPTPNEDRVRRLTRPAEALRAELLVALDQVVARQASYRSELGDLAPDPTPAAALRPRLTGLRAAVQAVDALATYLHELEEIALSDAAVFIQSVTEEILHRARKLPELTLAYDRVLHIDEQRRQLISTGIARARDKKDGTPPTA